MSEESSPTIQIWLEKRSSELPFQSELLKQAEGIRSEQRRQELLLSRTMMLAMTAEKVGTLPEHLRLLNKSSGEPYIEGYEDLGVSISHSPLWVGCAFCPAKGFGIDIESISRFSDHLGSKEQRWAHPNEIAKLAQLNGEKLRRALCQLWTRKEAFAKSKGQGIGMRFSELDLTALPEEVYQFRTFCDESSMLSVAAPKGYSLSWWPGSSSLVHQSFIPI